MNAYDSVIRRGVRSVLGRRAAHALVTSFAALLLGTACQFDVSPQAGRAWFAAGRDDAGPDARSPTTDRWIGRNAGAFDRADSSAGETPDAGGADSGPAADAGSVDASDADPGDGDADPGDASPADADPADADPADADPGDASPADADPGDAAVPDAAACADGALRIVPCGLNGRGEQKEVCMAGEFHELGACNDPDWTCPLEYYAARDGCDCNCGAYDPDCALPGAILYGCADGKTCSTTGSCEPQ